MTKFKGIMLNICSTCHMRCRHCSNVDTLCDMSAIDMRIVEKYIYEMNALGLDTLTIVGGEPFEEFELLKQICRTAHNNGKKIGIITNGFWARTIADGEKMLAMLPGVANIVVSSDLYHLEFVSEETVRNVVDICQKHNIGVSIHAVCANKTDAEKVKKIYKELSKRILVNTSALMPIGAAKTLDIDRFVLRDRIDKFSRFCSAGNIYVDINGNVYGCCNACLAQGSFFFYGNILEISLGEMAEMIEKDSMFQYITKCGPRGLKGILMNQDNYDVFLNREYTCECDACVDILRNIKI